MTNAADETDTRPLSGILADLRRDLPAGGRVSTGDLADALAARGIGALMVIFALALALPTGILPGLNTVFAIPLILLAAQEALGRHTVWLPEKIRARRLDADHVGRLIDILVPWLQRLESFIRPRQLWVTAGPLARLFGAVALFMALVASIPLPLTHTVPGIGLLLMAIGITTGDGLVVMAGAAVGMGYILLMGSLLAFLGPKALSALHPHVK